MRRIAVLRANALGDLIVALPALEALRAAYPEAEITLLGRRHHAEVLETRPGPVDRVVVLPEGLLGDQVERAPDLDRDSIISEVAGRGFDLAIQMHGGGRHSNPFLLALGARTTAGSRTSDAPSLDRWVAYEHYQWEIARYLDVVGLVGAPPVGVEPRLTVTPADEERLARELPALRGGAEGWAVIHPGATDPRRRWPVEAFAKVAAALARTGRRVVVTGTAPEHALIEPIVTAAGGAGLAADQLSLPALIALLRGADVVVANDTGPLHVAVAVGAPTVGIFWIGNLINAGPFSRTRHRPLVSWRLACPTCGANAAVDDRCQHDPSFVADVPVESVLAATTQLLASA